MKYPHLNSPRLLKNTVSVFGGLDKSDGCPENCFSDTENTSSAHFPLLSVREKRLKLAGFDTPPSALHTVNGITYTAGTAVYYNNVLQFDGLSDTPKKQIVSMGSKNLIFPDGYYINTLGTDEKGVCTDKGFLLPHLTAKPDVVSVTPCIPELPSPPISDDEPEDPKDGDYWLNSYLTPNVLYKYDGTSAAWNEVETTHTAITLNGIHNAVTIGRPVELSGFSFALDGVTTADAVETDILVIPKKTDCIMNIVIGKFGAVTVRQPLPLMDFVCEHQNRLFGCRYGKNIFGEFVNEIYASKPGAPELWFEYNGLSTDSYAASCGSEGEWTGIASHLGYVLFFKENRIHRLFGTKPANYTLYEDAYRGVKKGSEDSLALYNGTLYYHGTDGVYAYTGSAPSLISAPLGKTVFSNAVAAAANKIYYICLTDSSSHRILFAYDTEKNIWHKEDCSDFTRLAPLDGNALGILNDSGVFSLHLLRSSHVPALCSALFPNNEAEEDEVEWFAESGYLGLSMENNKYLNKLRLRFEGDAGSSVRIFFSCNSSENWEECGIFSHEKLSSRDVTVRPPRCDHLKLKLAGKGGCRLLSLTKYFEEASGVN